jgi:hypothetical protein
MSDQYYRDRAIRRARVVWISLGLLIFLGCFYLVVVGLFRDDCTKSFDRSPEAVIGSYLDAVSQGQAVDAQACWQHDAFFDLKSGCSEACLSQVYGHKFELADIKLNILESTQVQRSRIQADISVVCTSSGQTHDGEIELDSVSQNLSWRHWEIIHSTVGGSIAEPWCQ